MPEPSDVTGPRVSRVTCPGDAMRGWRGLGTMKTSWRSSVKLKGWSRNRSVVGGSSNHDILQLKCFHILKIFPPNLLTINPDPADECQSFPLRKLSGLFIANFRLMTPFTGLRISRGRTTRSSTGCPGWRSGWPGPSTPGTCSTTGGRHSTSQVRPAN